MNWADFSKYNFKNKISNYAGDTIIDGYAYTGIKGGLKIGDSKSYDVETEIGEFIPKLNGSVQCSFGNAIYGSLKVYENNTLVNTITLSNDGDCNIQNIKAFKKYKLTLTSSTTSQINYCSIWMYIYESINTYITIN